MNPSALLRPPASAAAPGATVRGERAFVRLERLAAWTDGWLARWLPAESNPLAHAGAAANFALAAAVLSGVALLIWYSPSLPLAYGSVSRMAAGTLGGWVRAVHRYSSDLAMLFVLVHAARVFAARKFTGARWLPWLSGVGLIALVWFIGWTGYWLVWDRPAQQIAVSSMRLLDALPIFGEPLGRLYVADRLVPSLLFFVVFFFHMLLPLAIAVGLAVHLARLNRTKLFPAGRLSVALALGLALAAVLAPAPLDQPAEMTFKAPHFTVDAWYATPLALALRFQHAGLWVALFGTTGVAAALPWLLGRRRAPVTFQPVIEESRCHACTQCTRDCPFDAIAMVPRTDAKKFPARALIDPAKCVGCNVCIGSCDSEGIALPWFDTREEEARIAAAATHGGSAWVALVAADIDEGMTRFDVSRWRARLPDFYVEAVPTAAWVRPKFVERLLQAGAPGVLIVRDARTEAPTRDGGRFVQARLKGERPPVFRPDRAGGRADWRVVDFDPARPRQLTRDAEAFREGRSAGSTPSRGRAAWAGLLLAAALEGFVIAPSRLTVANPAPPNPEFVFSFKALGDRVSDGVVDAAEDAKKPIHMRGRVTSKPHRAPVVVRLTIDGVTAERSYHAKGISHDGPALDEWREPLAAGQHVIAIEIITGPTAPPRRWTGELRAEPRRLQVITFEPESGFRRE